MTADDIRGFTQGPHITLLYMKAWGSPQAGEMALSAPQEMQHATDSYSREIRSKHFLSSLLGLTWQVSKLSLTGCRLDWNGEKNTPSELFKKDLPRKATYI